MPGHVDVVLQLPCRLVDWLAGWWGQRTSALPCSVQVPQAAIPSAAAAAAPAAATREFGLRAEATQRASERASERAKRTRRHRFPLS